MMKHIHLKLLSYPSFSPVKNWDFSSNLDINKLFGFMLLSKLVSFLYLSWRRKLLSGSTDWLIWSIYFKFIDIWWVSAVYLTWFFALNLLWALIRFDVLTSLMLPIGLIKELFSGITFVSWSELALSVIAGLNTEGFWNNCYSRCS